jgi:hypothetical protein
MTSFIDAENTFYEESFAGAATISGPFVDTSVYTAVRLWSYATGPLEVKIIYSDNSTGSGTLVTETYPVYANHATAVNSTIKKQYARTVAVNTSGDVITKVSVKTKHATRDPNPVLTYMTDDITANLNINLDAFDISVATVQVDYSTSSIAMYGTSVTASTAAINMKPIMTNVSGHVLVGSASTNFPLAIAGQFGVNTTPQVIAVDASGRVLVDANLQIANVDICASNPLSVSVTSMPLPANAATESTLSTFTTSYNSFATSTRDSVQTLATTVVNVGATYNADTSGVMSMAVRKDTLAPLAASGEYAPLQVNASGALYITGGGGGVQYIEDNPHDASVTGTMTLAVRSDALNALVGTTGDYTPLQVNASGALYVDTSDLLAFYTKPLVAGTFDISGDLSAGDVTTGIDLGNAFVTTLDRYWQIQIVGSTTTAAFEFVTQYSDSAATGYLGTPGLTPTMTEMSAGTFEFSININPILFRYVRLFCKTLGNDVVWKYVIAK